MRFKPIRDLRNLIRGFDLNKATERTLKARREDISSFNRDQLAIGMKTDGTWLPNYSAASVTKYGKKPGKIKLYDTGDFYKGITPDFAKTSFTLNGRDQKTEMLKADYGDEILGLSQRSIIDLAQDSLGQVQHEIRKQLKL